MSFGRDVTLGDLPNWPEGSPDVMQSIWITKDEYDALDEVPWPWIPIGRGPRGVQLATRHPIRGVRSGAE